MVLCKTTLIAPLLTIPILGGVFATLAMLMGSLNFSKKAMVNGKAETYTNIETDRFGYTTLNERNKSGSGAGMAALFIIFILYFTEE